MGDLQEKLDEFKNDSEYTYTKIKDILKDKYCWKCPMRTTSEQTRCREIHAGRVLLEAVQCGIISNLKIQEIAKAELDSIIIRIHKKTLNRQGGNIKENIIIFQIKSEQNPNLDPDSWLMVKINPRRLKIGDEILVPLEIHSNPLLGSVALISNFPFEIRKVKRFFLEGSFWYVELDNSRIITLESVFGILVKIFSE